MVEPETIAEDIAAEEAETNAASAVAIEEETTTVDSNKRVVDTTKKEPSSEDKPEETIPEEETVAAGEAERNVDKIVVQEKASAAGGKREITQPKYVKRMPPTLPDKKCFVKIVAIGDSGVGKTSLIQMFEHSRFTENFKPTIGADFSNKEISIDGKVVTLQIWDTAG